MTVKIVEGDLLDAFDRGEVNVIAHVTNCMGVMGSGIARSIKLRYPLVYKEYQQHLDASRKWVGGPEGTINYTNLGYHQDGWRYKKVYNLYAQYNYGRDYRHLNYGALSKCLTVMSYGLTKASELSVQDYDVIGFPFRMGSDRAGGDWDIVLEMINFHFRDNEVIIYQL